MNKLRINCQIIHTENYIYCQQCGSFLITINNKEMEKIINMDV